MAFSNSSAAPGGAPESPRPPEDRFIVRESGRATIVPSAEIDRVRAAGNYSELHAGAETFLLRRPISKVASDLDPARFIRIHRSSIVRRDTVRQVETTRHGGQIVTLRDGTRLAVGRTYRRQILSLIGRSRSGKG
jgi:two-component system LytT family response regulator